MSTGQIQTYFKRFHSLKDLLKSPLIWLSLVAALLYSSWPWAYFLDPMVGRHSLASELEAPHRPYNWLFIAMDVATGLVLAGIGAWQLRKHSSKLPHGVIISYLLFGLLVAVAALTPLVCDPSTQSCGPILHNYRIVIHGAASIFSVLFLLGALMGVTYRAHRQKSTSWGAIILSVLLMGWLYFGVASLGAIEYHLRPNNSMQDFFITLCSLSIIAVVVSIEAHVMTSRDS